MMGIYINNSRVGFEEFNGGKNIDISNHMFNLTDNIDLSGSLVVDGNTVLHLFSFKMPIFII
jgi:hypothetical protein